LALVPSSGDQLKIFVNNFISKLVSAFGTEPGTSLSLFLQLPLILKCVNIMKAQHLKKGVDSTSETPCLSNTGCLKQGTISRPILA
jgi:hypothetical protein